MPIIPDYTFKFHRRGDYDVYYQAINREAGATSFVQYINSDDYWYIMKGVRSGTVTVFTFTTPVKTSAATGWTNRAILTYTSFNEAFEQ